MLSLIRQDALLRCGLIANGYWNNYMIVLRITEAPNKKEEDDFAVQLSMIEIYNEQVKDLLNLKSD